MLEITRKVSEFGPLGELKRTLPLIAKSLQSLLLLLMIC